MQHIVLVTLEKIISTIYFNLEIHDSEKLFFFFRNNKRFLKFTINKEIHLFQTNVKAHPRMLGRNGGNDVFQNDVFQMIGKNIQYILLFRNRTIWAKNYSKVSKLNYSFQVFYI